MHGSILLTYTLDFLLAHCYGVLMKPRSVSYTLLGVPPTKPTPLAAKQRAQAHRVVSERIPPTLVKAISRKASSKRSVGDVSVAHIQPCQASTFLDQPTTRYKLHQRQEAHQARGMILQCCHFTIIDL